MPRHATYNVTFTDIAVTFTRVNAQGRSTPGATPRVIGFDVLRHAEDLAYNSTSLVERLREYYRCGPKGQYRLALDTVANTNMERLAGWTKHGDWQAYLANGKRGFIASQDTLSPAARRHLRQVGVAIEKRAMSAVEVIDHVNLPHQPPCVVAIDECLQFLAAWGRAEVVKRGAEAPAYRWATGAAWY
jgi:hypothetical protein